MFTDSDIMDLIMNVATKTKRQPPHRPPHLSPHRPPHPPGEDDCQPPFPPPPPPPRFGMGRLLEKLLNHDGGMTPTELADELKIRLPSLSEAIKRLELKGLIQKDPSPNNARSYLIFLTPAGKEHAEHYKRESEQFMAEFFNPLTEAEKEQLALLLTKLLKGECER